LVIMVIYLWYSMVPYWVISSDSHYEGIWKKYAGWPDAILGK